MKLGIHLMMWQDGYGTALLPLLKKAGDAGFDGAEFSVVMLEKRQDALDIRSAAADLGLGITNTVGLTPEQDIASADPAKVQAAQERLKRAIETAAVLGSPVLAGILNSGYGVRADSATELVERWQRSVNNLRPLVSFAAGHGVTLAIEPVNRYETDMITTAESGVQYIQDVGGEGLRLLFDVFHANMEEKSIPAAIRSAGKHIGHVHFSENHRGVPGTGTLPYPEIVGALKETGYTGWCVVEIIGVAGSEFARRFKVNNQVYPPDTAARLSAAYLRPLLGEAA